jgi:hypothetical protein
LQHYATCQRYYSCRDLEELEQNKDDVDDVEVLIIPPDIDEVTDEEDIQEN